uniref:Putative replicase n=1 Tax=Punsystermes virus TaxID=2796627 RepID=A0A7T7GUV3_9VIRU|nr:putative replicase [Punsystermes virus]
MVQSVKEEINMGSMSSKSQSFILKQALGPRLGSQVWQLLHKWYSCNGNQWTVKRTKAYYQAAVQLVAGNRDKVVGIYREFSIAYHKDTCLPKGPMSCVFKAALLTNNPVVLRRMFGALRIYTAYCAEEPTERDFSKHLKSITSLSDGVDEDNYYIIQSKRRIDEVCSFLARKEIPLSQPRIFDFHGRKSVHTPSRSKHYREIEGGKELPYFGHVLSLLTTKPMACSEHIFSTLDMPGVSALAHECGSLNENDDVTGHITVITERGAKTRAICTPKFWIQLTLKPLDTVLSAYGRRLGLSDRYDQNNGAAFMERKLNEGVTLHCFDLSSATDRFPLSLQLQALESLGLESWIDPIKETTVNWIYQKERVDYAMGQPMGVQPSFALFDLTHGALIAGIALKLGLDPKDSARNVGDDVIIADDRLAKSYSEYMKSIGIELSEPKLVDSNRLGMFAGFLAVKLKDSVHCFRPYKWSLTNSQEKLLQFFHFIGKNAFPNLRSMGKVWDLYQERSEYCYPDLSPLIPDDDVGPLAPAIDATRLRLTFGAIRSALRLENNLSYDVTSDAAHELVGSFFNYSSRGYDVSLRRPLSAEPFTSTSEDFEYLISNELRRQASSSAKSGINSESISTRDGKDLPTLNVF